MSTQGYTPPVGVYGAEGPEAPGAVATVGMFDGVHLGHRYILEQTALRAHRQGHRAVAVTFSRHPLSLIAPGRAPKALCTLGQRVALMHRCGIDRVVVLPFTPWLRALTAGQFMAMLRRRYGVTGVVMGYDHGFGSDRLRQPGEYARAGALAGVSVTTLQPFAVPTGAVTGDVPGADVVPSSSAVRRALSQGDIPGAEAMLGRPFTLTGTVARGRQLGRTIGFPTANIAVPGGLMLPQGGVYTATAHIGDEPANPSGASGHICKADPQGWPADYKALVNIGTNPTVAAGGAVSVEAHLVGFSGDLYGRTLTVALGRRVRPERKFPSLQALRAQITLDLQAPGGPGGSGPYGDGCPG